ncbi:MAG: hypothetical protein AB1545_01590 [Thermodesulfobacteriota bacterium]
MGQSSQAPVVVMSLAPGFLCVALVGTVIGIGGHLGLLPLAFAFALAGILAAVALVFYPGIGRHDTPARRTDEGSHILPSPTPTITPGKGQTEQEKEPESEKIKRKDRLKRETRKVNPVLVYQTAFGAEFFTAGNCCFLSRR